MPNKDKVPTKKVEKQKEEKPKVEKPKIEKPKNTNVMDIAGFGNEEDIMIKKNIQVLPELRDLIPPLTDEESQGLEDSIKEEGVKDPIEYALIKRKPVIVDGHNRYGKIEKLKIPLDKWDVRLVPLKTLPEIKKYMLRKQLHRRNLSPENRSYLRGLLYNDLKGEQGRVKGQIVTSNVAKDIAENEKVSDRQVKRDGAYAIGLDVIGTIKPEIKEKIRSGDKVITKAIIESVGKIKEEKERLEFAKNLIVDLYKPKKKIEKKKEKPKGKQLSKADQKIQDENMKFQEKRQEIASFLETSDPFDWEEYKRLNKELEAFK